MPTAVTPKTVAKYPNQPITAGSLQFTFTTAADTSGFTVPVSGKEFIILWNSGASPFTVTISGARDPYGFQQDLTTYSLAAGDFVVLPAATQQLYALSSGVLTITISNVGIKCAALLGTNLVY